MIGCVAVAAVAVLGLLHVLRGPHEVSTSYDAVDDAGGWLGAVVGEPLRSLLATAGATVAADRPRGGGGHPRHAGLAAHDRPDDRAGRPHGRRPGRRRRQAGARCGAPQVRRRVDARQRTSRCRRRGRSGCRRPDSGARPHQPRPPATAAVRLLPASRPRPGLPVRRRAPPCRRPTPPPVPARPSSSRSTSAPAPGGPWKLPPAKLLDRTTAQQVDRQAIEARGETSSSPWPSHGVETRLVGMTVGPTVTRYELELGARRQGRPGHGAPQGHRLRHGRHSTCASWRPSRAARPSASRCPTTPASSSPSATCWPRPRPRPPPIRSRSPSARTSPAGPCSSTWPPRPTCSSPAPRARASRAASTASSRRCSCAPRRTRCA